MNYMSGAKAQEYIEKYFELKYNFTDFLYAYCYNKGIDDPENDLTDEEYDQMEKKAEELIKPERLNELRNVITEDINERLRYFMKED